VRDIRELLEEKEQAVQQLRREVEALRSLIPWFSERGISISKSFIKEGGVEATTAIGTALQTAGPLLIEQDGFNSEIRARLAEAAENDLKLSQTNRFSRGLRRIASPLFSHMRVRI